MNTHQTIRDRGFVASLAGCFILAGIQTGGVGTGATGKGARRTARPILRG